MSARSLTAVALFLCALTAPAGAQTGAPASDSVTVTAPDKPTLDQVERQARAISLAGDIYKEPLGRFYEPICPGVTGLLPRDAAEIVIDRIRVDAERAGVPIDGRENCAPNIVVAFVKDGAREVRQILKSSGHLFFNIPTSEAKALERETGPVRAWAATSTTTRHQEKNTGDFHDGRLNFAGSLSGRTSMGPVETALVPSSDSHVFLPTQLGIDAAIVVIDVGAIQGMPVVQVADYAAMRSLARTKPARDGSAALTILNLFEADAVHPPELTSFDIAYLRSLYSAGGNLPAAIKLGGVAIELRREMIKTSAPER